MRLGEFEFHVDEVPGGIPCRVIAKLRPGLWRVSFGIGVNQLDGGYDRDWLEQELPEELRHPNAAFHVTLVR